MAAFFDPDALVRVSTSTIGGTADMLTHMQRFYSAALLKLLGIIGGWLTLLGIIYALFAQYYQARAARKLREAITGEVRDSSAKLQAEMRDMGERLHKELEKILKDPGNRHKEV